MFSIKSVARIAIIVSIFLTWLTTGCFIPVLAQVSPEVTTLASSTNQLTIAAFNVENLDPSDGSRFSKIAKLIVENLKSPDILGLTEIQDNNGVVQDSVVAADQTYKKLIQAIISAGGPTYSFTDISPIANQDGGEPGGNIRPGFIYKSSVTLINQNQGLATQAVALVKNPSGTELSLNPGRIQPADPAFDDSRKPLVAGFSFQGKPIYVILNHFVSKRDGTASDLKREKQATIVSAFVQDFLQIDPNSNIVVMGDLNDTSNSPTLSKLKGSQLTSLTESLPENDQYTYKFRGKLQQIDYILVSPNLLSKANPLVDIVHVNVGFSASVSDHDPVLGQFSLSSSPILSPSPGVTPQPLASGVLPGLSGQALLNKLVTNYKQKVTLNYDRAREELFGKIDNQSGSVTDIYTNFKVSIKPGINASKEAFSKGLNTEHIWPQSKGAEFVPPESDLHHLFPARIDVNNARGNKAFAEIEDSKTVAWYREANKSKAKPKSEIDEYSELGKNRFEPQESRKGDIARAIFYFYTFYKKEADASDPNYFNLQKTDLCNWNSIDLPNIQEVDRSRAIELVQGNENPFVLDSTLPQRIGYCS